jgi:SAM-dependent methyltransferase
MNPLTYFSDAAADYAKYRPTYPEVAIDKVLEGLGLPCQIVAADIGAGTGIASRQLAEKGIKVFAVEPNAEMRKAAISHPLIEVCDGTAEATNLPDASVDLVVCFQAFHWFNRKQSLLEFRRILQKYGRLALVWNYWELEDKFTKDYFRLLIKASKPYRDRSLLTQLRRWVKKVQRLPLKLLRNWGFFLPYSCLPYFVEVGRHRFTNKQAVDLSGLIGRAQSRGLVPRSGEGFEQLVADLTQLYSRSHSPDGLVDIVYRTRVILAEPLPELK